jgi:Kef-type K+ transport system membrane component KefB
MEVHTFFLYLLVILLTARIFAEIAARLQVPSVIGELCAGILLGPSLLDWITPNEVITLLAEIGVILLLFEVGLKTDLHRLFLAGRRSAYTALTGFTLPFLLGFAVSYVIFAQPLLVSLMVGGTLTATSIGITVRVLTDFDRHLAPEGQVVVGAAVLDDVLGVVLLALLYEFSTGGGINVGNAGKVLLFITVFFFIAPVAARLISLVIKRFHDNSQVSGLIPTTIVSLVLFFAWLAHEIGAPELLGGFAAGLALSRRFFMPLGIAIHTDPSFANKIDQSMRPIVSLFTPIFFVAVGLSLNLREIDWSSSFIWLFSLSLLVVAFFGKLFGPLLLRERLPIRLVIGLAMVPRGEVGLIFAELGRVSGIFNNEVHASLIIIIAVTTLVPPFLMKHIYSKYRERINNYWGSGEP